MGQVTIEGLKAADDLTAQIAQRSIDAGKDLRSGLTSMAASMKAAQGDYNGAYATMLSDPANAGKLGPASQNAPGALQQMSSAKIAGELPTGNDPASLQRLHNQGLLDATRAKAAGASDKITFKKDVTTGDQVELVGGMPTGRILREGKLFDPQTGQFSTARVGGSARPVTSNGVSQPAPQALTRSPHGDGSVNDPNYWNPDGTSKTQTPSPGPGTIPQQAAQASAENSPIDQALMDDEPDLATTGALDQNPAPKQPKAAATPKLLADEAIDSSGATVRLNPKQLTAIGAATKTWNADMKDTIKQINAANNSSEFLKTNIPGAQLIEKLNTIKSVTGSSRLPESFVNAYGNGKASGIINQINSALKEAEGEGLSDQTRQNMYKLNNALQIHALHDYDSQLKARVSQVSKLIGVDASIIKQKMASEGPSIVQQHLQEVQQLPPQAQAAYNFVHDNELNPDPVVKKQVEQTRKILQTQYKFGAE